MYGGEGLARRDREVMLVPFLLPGERATVAPEGRRSGVLHGRVVQVLSPSPERVEAECPYFTQCGGCHYQHLAYQAQVRAKVAILTETLRRGGVTAPLPEIETVSGEPWGYRNRSQFHIRGTKLGYFEMRSRDLCAIERCPISSSRINETIATLNRLIRDSRWPRFVRSLEVFTNETEVQLNVLETERPPARRFFDWVAESIPGAAAGALDYPAGEFIYRVGNKSFFQVNRFLINDLANRTLDRASGNHAIDLYAGVGLFSLPLTRRFKRVTAVESGAGAVRDLRFNTERAGVIVDAVQSQAESFLEKLSEAPDFVLADPPRAGLGKAAVRRLIELKPAALTIVACDPATLARDLAALTAGGYSVAEVTMMDLFPQTFHIETIVKLSAQS